MWSREEIAQRAAKVVQPGWAINLGIGIPTLIADLIDDDSIFIHSENGLLGMGPFPIDSEVDPQIINAGKQTVTIRAGGSTFDSATSFGMIRGGHIDAAFLGAMQVSATGDIANWKIPGKKVTGMGGAMDLVSGAKQVIALMTHVNKSGQSKLKLTCDLPLTGVGCVSLVITDRGVFRPEGDGFGVLDLATGVTFDSVALETEGRLVDLRDMV